MLGLVSVISADSRALLLLFRQSETRGDVTAQWLEMLSAQLLSCWIHSVFDYAPFDGLHIAHTGLETKDVYLK